MYRSRKVSVSPSRTDRRSREPERPNPRKYETLPLRNTGVSTYYGPKLTDKDTTMQKRYDVSPLKIRFGSKRSDQSPKREKETVRYRKYDTSPIRTTLRSRRQEASPLRDTINYNISRARKCSPSPSRDLARSRNRLDILESNIGNFSVDYVPRSPRLGFRARVPLRELPAAAGPTQSYRISGLSRDDNSDMEYLTRVREILLGEPIKGKTQHPAQILNHMYLGNQSNAESLRLLRKLGITHVLNCAGYKGPRKNPDENPYEGLDIDYYEFKADDRDGYDISQHFDEAFRYLDNVKRKGGTCLVHCALGINRSGATVVAYLMIHSKWSLLKAVEFVKKKRGVVLSNHGFQRQLIRFARQQDLLEPLPAEAVQNNSSTPVFERKLPKAGGHQAHQMFWHNDLEEIKTVEPRESVELGSGPHSAVLYRYERFMNRDKV